jgi:hypothetical protein
MLKFEQSPFLRLQSKLTTSAPHHQHSTVILIKHRFTISYQLRTRLSNIIAQRPIQRRSVPHRHELLRATTSFSTNRDTKYAPRNMARITSLIDLPVEMIELVARHTGKDMKYLRLVSSHVNAAVFKVFKERFFTDLTVLLATESSLRKAIKIIAHAAFGPAVQRLVLVDDSLADKREPHSSNSEHEDAIYFAQREMWEEGKDLRLLTRLFRRAGRAAGYQRYNSRAFWKASMARHNTTIRTSMLRSMTTASTP